MAITINSSPNTYQQSGSPQLYRISSTNQAQTNFKYVVDIYDSTPTLITRLKINKYTDNYGYVDVSRLLESFITTDINTFPSNSTDCPYIYGNENIKQYSIDFGEEYGTTPTIYANLTSSGTKYVVNGAGTPIQDNSQVIDLSTNYILDTSSSKFLRPSNYGRSATKPIMIKENEAYQFSYLVTTNNQAYRLRVITTDSLGFTVTTNILLQYTTISDNDRKFQVVPVGYDLNNLDATTFGISQPIITTNTVSYTIQILDNTNTAASEMSYFKIDRICTKNEAIRLHWLNRHGGYDSFTFDRASIKTTDIERLSYKSPLGTYGTVNQSYDKTFSSKSQDKFTLNSDWISEDCAEMLKDLFTSPVVYRYDDTTDSTYGFIRYKVLTTSYITKKESSDKLFNVSIDVQPAFNTYRQRL